MIYGTILQEFHQAQRLYIKNSHFVFHFQVWNYKIQNFLFFLGFRTFNKYAVLLLAFTTRYLCFLNKIVAKSLETMF